MCLSTGGKERNKPAAHHNTYTELCFFNRGNRSAVGNFTKHRWDVDLPEEPDPDTGVPLAEQTAANAICTALPGHTHLLTHGWTKEQQSRSLMCSEVVPICERLKSSPCDNSETEKDLSRQQRASQKLNSDISLTKKFQMNFDSTKQFKFKVLKNLCKQILLSTNVPMSKSSTQQLEMKL